MSTVSDFKNCLLHVVNDIGFTEAKWASEDWKKTWPLISQEVLNDAYQQQSLVLSIFTEMGTITCRQCKSFARVDQKKTEQRAGRENYFKVVSDFTAFRVNCSVNEIPAKIDRLRALVLANGGQMHVRGSSEDRPYGACRNADGTFTDITQYVYIFLEKVGYPIEFQIGHEFAAHTFTIDSALRDNRACGKVDLWDKSFYSKVQKYILAKANGDESEPKEEIVALAEEIHQNSVPDDLQKILNRIE